MDEDPRNANIVPFGKHKGKTIEEIQAFDPRYLDWLTAQDWFRDKFVILHQTIINRGAEPEETPDHNALQALFLDDAFCLKIAEAASNLTFEEEFSKHQKREVELIERSVQDCEKEFAEANEWWRGSAQKKLDECKARLTEAWAKIFKPEIRHREFETRGVDVKFAVICPYIREGFQIEIKPCVSDDYPAVLRQMKRLMTDTYGPKTILFLERYTGTGATLDQFIAIFKASNIAVVFRHQVDP